MDKVVGIGKFGCMVAEEFTTYPEYRIYQIGPANPGKADLEVPLQASIEDYESTANSDEIAIYLRSIKKKDGVLVILSGGDPINGIALRVLEQIKDSKVTVLYVAPDRQIMSDIQKRDDKIVFGILQEYARSGVIAEVLLLGRPAVENLVGDVPISEYEKSTNHFIAYIVAMVNYFKNTESVFESRAEKANISRIATYGVASLEPSADINYLFPLSDWQDAHFYYGIPEGELSKNASLMREIKAQARRFSKEGINTGFSVHSTTFENIMVLCTAGTKDVQEAQ